MSDPHEVLIGLALSGAILGLVTMIDDHKDTQMQFFGCYTKFYF